MENTKTKKFRHYQRDTQANPIQILESDIAIFKLLFRHRFIDRKQIFALTDPKSEQYQRKRLKQLWDNGYIDRPNAQRGRFGNFPMVYALGDKGAKVLEREMNIKFPNVGWTWKNKSVKDFFFDHTMLVSRFMVMVELACRKRDDLEFVSTEQVIKERQIKAGALKDPLSWFVNFRYNNKSYNLQTIPDSAFGIRIKGDKTKWFFLEADRGTETVSGFSAYKNTFYKKMIKYNQSYNQKLLSRFFNFSAARVITITPSAKRIESMIEAAQAMPYEQNKKYLGMFVFTTEDKLDNLDNPEIVLNDIWISGYNKKTNLIG